MLAIRMQRTGRKGHAQFRLIAQDRRFSPSSGRVVAFLGSYDPHTKVAKIDAEKVAGYLANGARPTDRAASLLKAEGIKLPDWVSVSAPQKKAIKNPEKLKRNRPAAPVAEAEPESPKEEVAPEASGPSTEAPQVAVTDDNAVAEAEEKVEETVAEDEPVADEAKEIPAEPEVTEPASEAPVEETAAAESDDASPEKEA
jgi:small subunit ribosomal protein S16